MIDLKTFLIIILFVIFIIIKLIIRLSIVIAILIVIAFSISSCKKNLIKSSISDTTIIGGNKLEASFNDRERDTIYLMDSIFTIKYFKDKETIYLSGEIRRDTIIKNIPVEKEIQVIEKEVRSFKDELYFWILVFCVLILSIKLIFTKK